MAMVRVWNDNKYPYKETFKEQDIVIPAKAYIEMEYFEAYEFRGTYKAPKLDYDNNPLPESFKMIRIEENPAAKPEVKAEATQCIACSFKATSEKELEKHIQERHAHDAVVDEEVEKALKAKKKAG